MALRMVLYEADLGTFSTSTSARDSTLQTQGSTLQTQGYTLQT